MIRAAMVAGNVVALLALWTRAGTRRVLPLTFSCSCRSVSASSS
jgi:hypothetical protein